MAIKTGVRLLVACLLLSVLDIAKAQVTRTVNVAGTGTVSGPPDLATISTGVVTMANTAMEALDDNNNAVSRVLDVLRSQGIQDKDVQTTSFNVNPQFERGVGGQRGEIIGYRVSNQVQVKVRDIDTLGQILDALVTAGSNRISGVSFSIADPKPLQDQAREAAVADAQSRASLYARAAGVKLGRIISISEQPIAQPRPEGGRFFAADSVASVPIATGELDISATVFILFEIMGA